MNLKIQVNGGFKNNYLLSNYAYYQKFNIKIILTPY